MSDSQAAVSDEEYLRTVAGRTRTIRRARELSQRQLAEASGVSRSFIAGFERGRHSIDLLRLRRLTLALETTVEALVRGIDESSDGNNAPAST